MAAAVEAEASGERLIRLGLPAVVDPANGGSTASWMPTKANTLIAPTAATSHSEATTLFQTSRLPCRPA